MLVTLTAVGYGVIFPVTSLGKTIMTLSMMGGVIYMTMPLSIVSASFMSRPEPSARERVLKSNGLTGSRTSSPRGMLVGDKIVLVHHWIPPFIW